ncbi:hypothetical protein [Agromyces archimandritae]|uniref:Uncharacterized protein n=1 Tax=Agromyces archimandritae TaxID=2781962 RepID=A0A975FM66_9MICO|nr:hypothetical protein [Agromyces archimandritae]QTX04674.1 hypothetical protein G127AT_15745 [Agromyces archimandritae]
MTSFTPAIHAERTPRLDRIERAAVAMSLALERWAGRRSLERMRRLEMREVIAREQNRAFQDYGIWTRPR